LQKSCNEKEKIEEKMVGRVIARIEMKGFEGINGGNINELNGWYLFCFKLSKIGERKNFA
jgi:hypothetical protein